MEGSYVLRGKFSARLYGKCSQDKWSIIKEPHTEEKAGGRKMKSELSKDFQIMYDLFVWIECYVVVLHLQRGESAA